MSASITTSREEHRRYCAQPEGGWLGDMKGVYGQPGDVRRCVHGRVMIGFEIPGTCPAYWRDISKFWEPLRYRRALRVLADPNYCLMNTRNIERPPFMGMPR